MTYRLRNFVDTMRILTYSFLSSRLDSPKLQAKVYGSYYGPVPKDELGEPCENVPSDCDYH